jgi:MFS family permease
VIPDVEIPAFYAIAMGVDAVAALAVGKAYDRYGTGVLLLVPVTGMLVALVAFSPSYWMALAGAVLWGISMAMQETVLRAAVVDFTPSGGRGFAYGIFNTIYGGAWFAGSIVIGALYTVNPFYAAGFMILAQVLSIPALLLLVKRERGGEVAG